MDPFGPSAIENWEWAAAFLPVLVGAIIRRGWSRRWQATAAVAVYAAYGLLGSLIRGDLDGLTWGSAEQVATSVLAVAMIGHTSYKTLWAAVPLPQFVEARTGGDPMGEGGTNPAPASAR